MAKNSRLVNEFSWSFSRQNTFQECKKRYWYTYYGSWEGWPKTPWDSRPSIDPLASYLYMIKQMQRLPLYIGSCVHETIEHFLKEQMKGQRAPFTKEKMTEHALKSFERGLVDSTSQAWRQSPKKHLNLFEHYYQIPIAETAFDDAKQKIASCIANWCDSPISKMLFDERARWLSVEEMGTFHLADKFKIIVVVDLAIKWKSQSGDIFILFDWKTGQKNVKTDEQLMSYALYATKAWQAPTDKIILSPFYLLSNEYSKIGCGQKEPIEEGTLKRVEQDIVSSCEAMYDLIKNLELFAGSPPPDPKLFPYTQERNQCTLCPFQELCKKANYQECSVAEIKDIVKTVV